MYLLLSSPPRSSLVIVVFDFNDSHNDVTPVSPMPLPVLMIIKSYLKQFQESSVLFLFSCLTSQIELLTGNDVHHK